MFKKIFALGLIALIVAVIGIFMYNVQVDNRIIDLQNLFAKENAKVETFHDTMWKTIKQQANVTDKMKEAFKEIYIPLIQGRYSQGDGTLMKWIKEDNPKFDQAAYTKLMNSIESLRREFFAIQDTIQGVVKEHNDMIGMPIRAKDGTILRVKKKFPTGYFIDDDIEFLEFVPISSTASKEVMKTRVDDNTDL